MLAPEYAALLAGYARWQDRLRSSRPALPMCYTARTSVENANTIYARLSEGSFSRCARPQFAVAGRKAIAGSDIFNASILIVDDQDV